LPFRASGTDPGSIVQVFGIFEGGGAKGLAHVGAIAVAQELGVQFVGVAGTSAGAILAGLVAVGYAPKALYDSATCDGLLAHNLTELFGAGRWQEWERFSAAFKAQLEDGSFFRAWLGAPWFYRRWRGPLTRMLTEHGFFDTAPIEETLDRWLRAAQIRIPESQPRLLFSDLDPTKVPPLRIIASDVERQSPVVFSRERTPDVPVAKAIAASIAIPFFFRPVEIEVDGARRTLVDGGLVANFPVWIFDDARRRRRADPTPIIGFRLLERTDAPSESRGSPLSFARALLETALNANVEIHARGIDDLYTFPIEVNVSTYDFDLSAARKESLYQSARQQAGYKLLKEVAPRNPRVLAVMLKEAAELFVKEARFDRHLRANLALLSSRDTLRIVAGFNMDSDADDRLEFELDASACGECWNKHDLVVFDVGLYLRTRAAIPGLSKYQQALVRPTLSTILSIPIFDPARFLPAREDVFNPLIGILNFDSDSASVSDFMQATGAARAAAVMCGEILTARLPA
jgi:NTE family protein